MAEYKFIKPDFIPTGTRVDIEDYEGGRPDNDMSPIADTKSSVSVNEHIMGQPLPAIAQPHATAAPTTLSSILHPQRAIGDATNILRIKLPLPNIASAIGRIIQGTGFRLLIAATRLPTIEEEPEDVHEASALLSIVTPSATLLRPSFNSWVQPS